MLNRKLILTKNKDEAMAQKTKKGPNPSPRQAVASTRKKPALSVCMIVKDEEKMLPDCLNSINGLWDELIIVDTGSRDRTVAIAEDFGAKIYHHPWQNNFSLHRNQSIGYATGDWILQIDADERLDEASYKNVLPLLQNALENVHGYCVIIQDFKKDGSQSVRFNYPRIFRNNVGVHYEAAVHNQVVLDGKVDYSEIQLNHFGYDLDPLSMLKKFRRSVRLLRREAKENPDDPRAFYYLANAYSQYQKFPKAIEYARKTLEILRRMPGAPPYYLSIYHGLIGGLVAEGQLDEAKEVCEEALQVRQDYVDVFYHLARINYMQKNFEPAIAAGERYLELARFYNADPAKLENINYYTLDRNYRVNFWLGISSIALKDEVAGMKYIEAGLAENNSDHSTVLEMIHNAFAVCNTNLAGDIVKKAFTRYKDSATFFYFLVQELARIDMLVLLPELVQSLEQDDAICRDSFAKILYNISSKNESEALAGLRKFDKSNEKYIHAQLCEFILRHGENSMMQVPRVLRDNFPNLEFCHLVAGVLGDDLSQFDISRVEQFLAEKDRAKELKLLAHLLRLYHAILLNNADTLLESLATLIEISDLETAPILDDLEDLKRILATFAQKADQSLCPEAGDLAVKIGEIYFSDDPVFMSFKYRRDILRSTRRGPYSSHLRFYFKYLFLPQYSWLKNDSASAQNLQSALRAKKA